MIHSRSMGIEYLLTYIMISKFAALFKPFRFEDQVFLEDQVQNEELLFASTLLKCLIYVMLR
jgi:hypothetical protein